MKAQNNILSHYITHVFLTASEMLPLICNTAHL